MIKQETFNAILNYLATKPYQEVAQIFQMIQKDIEENKKNNEEIDSDNQ